MRRWLKIGRERAILRSALAACLIVGTSITLINEPSAAVSGLWSPALVARVLLAFGIPFCVSPTAAVMATCRERARYGDLC